MRKIIFILFIIISSCTITRQAAERKIARFEANYPDIVKEKIKYDTTYIRDTFHVEIPGEIDSTSIDSLLKMIQSQLIHDTITVHDTLVLHVLKNIKQYIYKECTPDHIIKQGSYLLTSDKDTIIIGVKGLPTGLIVSIIQHKKFIKEIKTDIQEAPKLTFWNKLEATWDWLLIGILIGFVLCLIITWRKK